MLNNLPKVIKLMGDRKVVSKLRQAGCRDSALDYYAILTFPQSPWESGDSEAKRNFREGVINVKWPRAVQTGKEICVLDLEMRSSWWFLSEQLQWQHGASCPVAAGRGIRRQSEAQGQNYTESPCGVMEGAWADSSRDLDSNPNLLLASCVTLGISLYLWTLSQ